MHRFPTKRLSLSASDQCVVTNKNKHTHTRTHTRTHDYLPLARTADNAAALMQQINASVCFLVVAACVCVCVFASLFDKANTTRLHGGSSGNAI